MKYFLRFSVSGMIGFAITAALFIGMLSLLKGKTKQHTNTDANINFSFVKEYKELEEKERKKLEIPERQQVSQPPAAPTLVNDNSSKENITLPEQFGLAKNTNIIKGINIPSLNHGHGLQHEVSNGGLKAGIAPMYPPIELMKKTEGWVEVLISINEFGHVSAVDILQAEPRRVFNTAAIKAVRKWKFYPKKVSGIAVSYQVTQKIEFKIDEE